MKKTTTTTTTTTDRLDRNHPHLQHGAGATYLSGSDRYPYEVITANFFAGGLKKGLVKSVIVRRLRAISTSGCPAYTESQSYRFESQPGTRTEEFRAFYAKGSDRMLGLTRASRSSSRHRSYDLHLGQAQKYRDPSF